MAMKRAESLDSPNPLTGGKANTYTQVTNRELPAPKAVRDSTLTDKSEARRLRKAHVEAVGPGGHANPALGYDKPEGMGDRQFSWLMGVHHMFPHQGTGPAINEPHDASPDVTVQRRAEDLTGEEYRKASDTLAHFGHDRKDPLGSLTDTLHRQTRRVIAEHVRAGVEESASQLFYGGPVNTDISEHSPDLDAAHTKGVRESTDTFEKYSRSIATHPTFINRTPDLTPQQRTHGARATLAQAAADTSPNAKWRDGDKWPNLDQAHESVTAALEDRPARFITGRTPNEHKASDRADQMIKSQQFESHHYGDPASAPKTIAFRGALSNRNSPDAFAVDDIHHASLSAPGLSTAKSKKYNDSDGKIRSVYPDEPKSATRGLTARYKVTASGKTIPDAGLSRPEQMLDKGKPYVHSLNDRAMRQVTSDLGINRSVNHTDNTHALQGALWGSQQVRRSDVDVSHADQYPVVRDWGAEGSDDLTEQGRALFGSRKGIGAQFTRNPNTVGISKDGSSSNDVHRTKPYDIV